MSLFHAIVLLVVGLALVIAGGNYLTDGAEAIALRLKVSKLVVGLTVVAIGSSTPDFVIAFFSTLEGKSQLAVGDIVGANIFDLLLVVGLVALITPFQVSPGMRRELPMLALSCFALFVVADDHLFDWGAPDVISRTDGLLLLCFFGIYMYMTLKMARSVPVEPPSAARPAAVGAGRKPGRQLITIRGRHDHSASPKPPMAVWLSIVCVLGGLAGLVVGGNWIVDGATVIARKAGMSEALVGLTIVAFGSSVPDLATSVIAAVKKQPAIALGNVVGACTFNVFFILGICASFRPVKSPSLTVVDFSVLLGAGLLLWLFASIRGRRMNRVEGALLVLLYLAYWAYLIITGMAK